MPGIRSRTSAKAIIGTAALVALLPALVSCGGGGGDFAKDDKVLISIGGAFSTSYLPTYVAVNKGFLDEELEEHDRTVELVDFSSSVDATKALLSGDVDYASSQASALLSAAAGGADLKVISQFYDTDGNLMLVRKGLPTSVEDLGDRRWGIASFGAASNVTSTTVATRAGFDPEKIDLIAVGPPSAYVPALSTKKVDVLFAGEPAADELLASGQAELVLDLFDPQEVESIYGGEYATSNLQARNAFLESESDVTKAVVAAHTRAMEWIQENLDDPQAIADVLPDEMKSEAIEEVIDRIGQGLSDDGTVTQESLENTIKASDEAGLLDNASEIDAENLVDNSFQPQ